MRTTLFPFALATALLALAGCSNDNEDTTESAKYITVTTSIGQMTRVVTHTDGSQSFADGDQISLYAWIGTNTEQTQMVVDGVTNTCNGSSWIPDTQMLWADMTSGHYFLGIYPARTVTSFTAEPYTLTAAGNNDLLVARKTEAVTATGNPVSLTFDHIMARLVVNLNFRNQFSADELAKVSVKAKVKTEATVNYLNETAVPAADAGQKEWMLTATTAATGYAQSCHTIAVPQTGVRTLVITVDGKDFTYIHTADIPLTAGKYTTVNLTVGRDIIEVDSVSINDWQQGETIEGGEALD